MDTIRYNESWPWGINITHVFPDGLGYGGVSFEKQCPSGFIHDLVVHPSAREHGRGSQLLHMLEREIVNYAHRHLAVLEVVPGTWMEQWYKRNGYAETGKKEGGFIELCKKLQ